MVTCHNTGIEVIRNGFTGAAKGLICTHEMEGFSARTRQGDRQRAWLQFPDSESLPPPDLRRDMYRWRGRK